MQRLDQIEQSKETARHNLWPTQPPKREQRNRTRLIQNGGTSKRLPRETPGIRPRPDDPARPAETVHNARQHLNPYHPTTKIRTRKIHILVRRPQSTI